MFGQYGQRGARIRRFRRDIAGRRGRWFAATLACFSAAAILLTAGFLLRAIPSLCCFLLSVPSTGAGFYCGRIWRKWVKSLTVEEALEQDPRPPIFYLRPFRADKVRFTSWRRRGVVITRRLAFIAYVLVVGWFIALILGLYRHLTAGGKEASPTESGKLSAEQFFVSLLDPLGPVIAIGRPGERTPPVGAARMYLGDEWKDVVQDLLKKSQLILMFAGTTPHFAWELERVFHSDPFVPTILILPFFQRYRQSQVDRFADMFAASTGRSLSSNLRKTRAAYFTKAGEIIEIRDQDTRDERALNELNPFLGPIAQIMELNRPGWTEGYVDFARENHRTNRRWLLGGAIAIILIVLGGISFNRWTHYKAQQTANADQFWADVAQGTAPCFDPKLATVIPNPNVCGNFLIQRTATSAELCFRPDFVKPFHGADACEAYLLQTALADADECKEATFAKVFPDQKVCDEAFQRNLCPYNPPPVALDECAESWKMFIYQLRTRKPIAP
jgi:hypothetical protein